MPFDFKGDHNFSHNDVDVNAKVNVKASFIQSAGPAITMLTAFVIVIGSAVIIYMAVAHAALIEELSVVLVIGVCAFLALKGANHTVRDSAETWAHLSYAAAQKRRNAVLSATPSHVVIDQPHVRVENAREIAETYHYGNQSKEELAENAASLRKPSPPLKSLLSDGTLLGLAKENTNLPIKDKKLVIAFDDKGKPIIDKFYALRCAALGGVQGSGKTTSTMFYSYQSALFGFKLVVIDPHMNEQEEGLAPRLAPVGFSFAMSPVGDEEKDVVLRLQTLDVELKRRKAPGGMKGKLVIVTVIDELNVLLRSIRDDKLRAFCLEVILNLAQEGRKFGMFIFVAGQIWSANSIGGADVRQSFPSRVAHKMESDQMKMLLGCSDSTITKFAPDDDPLRPGDALFALANGNLLRAGIPWTEKSDGYEIASLVKRFKLSGAGIAIPNYVEVSEVQSSPDTLIGETAGSFGETSESPETGQLLGNFGTEAWDEMAWEAKQAWVSERYTQGKGKLKMLDEIDPKIRPGDNKAYRQLSGEIDTLLESIGVK